MTDREERQHVIEVLKQMRLDYEDFWEENDTEEIKAMNYAIASIETDLKYDLLYEGVDCNNCKNNLHRGDGSTYCATGDGMCHYECEEPTTKNDLGIDAVSRQAVIDLMMQKWGENFSGDDAMQESIDAIRVMPPVTPQEPVLDKIRAEIDNALSDGMIHKKTVLGIIDKYKAESEGKENGTN